MREQKGLKPQDILVLLWLLVHSDREQVRQIDLAYALNISQSEAGLALLRLMKSQLITDRKKPIKAAVIEFLISGLKYVYPAEPGAMTRGMPTAHSAPPLANKIQSNSDENYVWPDPQGKSRGQSITPIYKSIPYAAQGDERLYEMLALIDAIRVGRARESNIASEELKRRIKGA